MQAGEKGKTREADVKSELYEVLALLDRASISKEREKELMDKIHQFTPALTDILHPPRTTSVAATVIAVHKSSATSDRINVFLDTAIGEEEQELSPSSVGSVVEIGAEG